MEIVPTNAKWGRGSGVQLFKGKEGQQRGGRWREVTRARGGCDRTRVCTKMNKWLVSTKSEKVGGSRCRTDGPLGPGYTEPGGDGGL